MRFRSSTVQPVDRFITGDLDGDGRVSLWELVTSTLFVMGLLFVGLNVAAVAQD